MKQYFKRVNWQSLLQVLTGISLFFVPEAVLGQTEDQKQTFLETLARSERLSDNCMPNANDLRTGEVHGVTFSGRRAPGSEVTVRVGKDRRAVHLFLYSPQDVVWRLSLEDGADVNTIYLMGPKPSVVLDLPEDVLVYSIGYGDNGQTLRHCKPTEDVAAKFADAAFYYAWAPQRHHNFEKALAAYAGQNVASLVLIEPDQTVGVISRTSIEKTFQTRQAGEAVMRNTHLPGVFEPFAEAVELPQDLSSTEVHDWLIDVGAAETAGEVVLDFLCLREEAAYWVVGMDTATFGSWCEARERWDASLQLVLQRAIDIGERYTCDDGRHVIIYVPDQIDTVGRFVNCSVSVWKDAK